MRARHWYTIVGSILVLLAWTITDPDLGLITGLTFGAGTVATIVVLSKAVLYTTLLHYTRKGLLDYLDLREYFAQAKKDSVGSAVALVAVAIYTLAIAVVIYASTTS